MTDAPFDYRSGARRLVYALLARAKDHERVALTAPDDTIIAVAVGKMEAYRAAAEMVEQELSHSGPASQTYPNPNST